MPPIPIRYYAYLALLLIVAGLGFNYWHRGEEIKKLTTEKASLQQDLDIAEASYDWLQKENARDEQLYLELKSSYTAIDKQLTDTKSRLGKLRSTPGTPDYELLHQKLTPAVLDDLNGVQQAVPQNSASTASDAAHP